VSDRLLMNEVVRGFVLTLVNRKATEVRVVNES
jgi:hypothetical protein